MTVPAQAAEAGDSRVRTRNGDHEIDLVLVRDDGRVPAIEVKLANTVDDKNVRHLHWLSDQLGDRLLDALVVNTGPEPAGWLLPMIGDLEIWRSGDLGGHQEVHVLA